MGEHATYLATQALSSSHVVSWNEATLLPGSDRQMCKVNKNPFKAFILHCKMMTIKPGHAQLLILCPVFMFKKAPLMHLRSTMLFWLRNRSQILTCQQHTEMCPDPLFIAPDILK